MPVIGIDQVPAGFPRPRFADYLGNFYGVQTRQVTDALLAALLGQAGRIGQVPTTPTPRNPGQLTFPSGATTPTSPQELAQLRALGGVPSRQGDVIPFGQPSTGGVSYAPPTRFGMLPNLDRQSTEADIAYKQAQTRALTPEFEAAKLRSFLGLPPTGTTPSGGGLTPEKKQQIEDDALAGDEAAVAAYNYLERLGVL